MIALSPNPGASCQQRSWILGSRPLQVCSAIFLITLLWTWMRAGERSWARYSLDISVINTANNSIASKEVINITDASTSDSVPTLITQPHTLPRPLQDLTNIPQRSNGSLPDYHLLNTTATFSVTPFPPLPPPDEEEYVAFCLIIKNQSIDMPEFFTHHYYHHGIRRFYVYDDGSKPPLQTKPYVSSWGIPDSAIDFTYIDDISTEDRNKLQPNMYTDCTKKALGKHKWVAWLDPDEFLEMRGENPPTLISFLKDWEKNATVGALGVHWLGHNSDGHMNKQPGDVRKSFRMCVANEALEPPQESLRCTVPANEHVKTFVRPDRFKDIENIHWARTTNGTVQVSEHGDLIWTWCQTPVSHDIWALHHYITKSREDYNIKKERQRVEGGTYDDTWWNCMHQQSANVTCPELAAYVP